MEESEKGQEQEVPIIEKLDESLVKKFAFNINELDNDYSLNYELDHTGMSTYDENQKNEILTKYINNISKHVYSTNLLVPDQKFNVQMKVYQKVNNPTMIDGFLPKVIKALVYNLYMFGIFKWGKFIVFDRQRNDNQVTYFYFNSMEGNVSSGILQAVLSKQIENFIQNDKSNVKNNLLKLIEKHGYTLQNNEQKKYLFGKGHVLLTKTEKIACKTDLTTIFSFMQQSKESTKSEGKFKQLKLDLSSLLFFQIVEKH